MNLPGAAAAGGESRAQPGEPEILAALGTQDGFALLRRAYGLFGRSMALVSSFGIESAVLLDMVARIDPGLPVIFLDTGRLFAETLAYRDRLRELLGLSDLRTVRPDPAELARLDADGTLWRRDPDLCCALRKSEPLDRALSGFRAWITGRKRYQGGLRRHLPLVERDPLRAAFKLNPLATWSPGDVRRYCAQRGLPPHPLALRGYASVGCAVCTTPTAPGEPPRAGRWRGLDKSECGIHLPPACAGGWAAGDR